jgi:L-ascorbate metabolism protein UlaG (beta-lactamase superfamily)
MIAQSPSISTIPEGLRFSVEDVVLANAAEITAINRVGVVLFFDQALVLIDPVGPQSQFSRFGRPDIVVLTKAHPDHFSIDTFIGLLRRDTVVLAPQTVIDQLPLMISNNVIVPFDAGAAQVVDGIAFTAVTGGSSAPDGAQVYERTRGDIGVVMEVDETLLYF